MNFKNLQKKYDLPDSIKVILKRTPKGGFYAKLPDYPGCMTEADNVGELLENVTDAVLTYFDVSREDSNRVNGIYMPPLHLIDKLMGGSWVSRPVKIDVHTQLKAEFLYYVSQGSYGKYSSFR